MPAPLPTHNVTTERRFRCEDDIWDAFVKAEGKGHCSRTIKMLIMWHIGLLDSPPPRRVHPTTATDTSEGNTHA